LEALTTVSPKVSASLAQKHQVARDLRDVAEQFEALFIQQILKQGRAAKLSEDILGGEAVDTYTSMLDQERATQLSKTVNLGIAEALVSQFEHLTSAPSND
jgi:peptidoglycan hydrolase FlgJ